MVTREPGEHLLGRQREPEVLDRLLEVVGGGRGEVLAVHGEPGVGKTALLEYAVEAAAGVSGRPRRRGRTGDEASVRGAPARCGRLRQASGGGP